MKYFNANLAMKRKYTDDHFNKKFQKDLSSKSVGFRIPFI